MNKWTFTILFMSILLVSCNNNSDKPNESSTQEEHHHDEGPIVLNDVEKWKVDDNMMVHIQNMEKDINSFDTTSNNYAGLAKSIDSNLDLLTSNCTMKGQAHDELHKWLLPFLDLSEKFSDSDSEQEYANNFEKIKTSFSTFNTYFK